MPVGSGFSQPKPTGDATLGVVVQQTALAPTSSPRIGPASRSVVPKKWLMLEPGLAGQRRRERGQERKKKKKKRRDGDDLLGIVKGLPTDEGSHNDRGKLSLSRTRLRPEAGVSFPAPCEGPDFFGCLVLGAWCFGGAQKPTDRPTDWNWPTSASNSQLCSSQTPVAEHATRTHAIGSSRQVCASADYYQRKTEEGQKK